MPVDPSMAVNGAEWAIGGVSPVEGGSQAPGATSPEGAGGFGDMLGQQIANLEKTQQTAADQSQALATGQSSDLASVVSAVERARLSMELASTIRTKGIEAYQEVFRTQV